MKQMAKESEAGIITFHSFVLYIFLNMKVY